MATLRSTVTVASKTVDCFQSELSRSAPAISMELLANPASGPPSVQVSRTLGPLDRESHSVDPESLSVDGTQNTHLRTVSPPPRSSVNQNSVEKRSRSTVSGLPVASETVDSPLEQLRCPTMVIPYLPGIGDKLKKIASDFDVRVWYTYPGKTMDRFNLHRGQAHSSKSRYSVYNAQCICGLEYVGESARNLKVRLSEHIHKSSKSALSLHFRTDSKQHSEAMHNTVVLARERNNQKRKIIESLCIESKRPKLCNTGLSTEIPAIWKLCAECVEKELAG